MVNDNNTYICIKKDSSPALQSNMNSLLLTLMKKEQLSQNLYQCLCRSDGITPPIYGIPKVQKPDVPLRPIVSFYSPPIYHLSKHLCHISPMVDNSMAHVKNSSNFVTFITTHQLENEIFVSFYVVSLFINVPTKLAILVASQRLEVTLTRQIGQYFP